CILRNPFLKNVITFLSGYTIILIISCINSNINLKNLINSEKIYFDIILKYRKLPIRNPTITNPLITPSVFFTKNIKNINVTINQKIKSSINDNIFLGFE